MKERGVIDGVHRHVPNSVYVMGTTLLTTTSPGTPDYYYDLQRDLWVEYKAFNRDDHLPSLIPESALPTAKQRAWLNRRYTAGGNVCVIVGLKLRSRVHGFILESPPEWSERLPLSVYQPRIRPAAELGAYIYSRVR